MPTPDPIAKLQRPDFNNPKTLHEIVNWFATRPLISGSGSWPLYMLVERIARIAKEMRENPDNRDSTTILSWADRLEGLED